MPWATDQFDRFVPASDFRVRGLRNRHRRAGLGVPLIAIRDERGETAPRDDFLAPIATVPATALLRFTPDSLDLGASEIVASLELYSSFDTHDVEMGGSRVPLEADFTAALAYDLEESRIWSFELEGFMSSDDLAARTGLFLLRPHTPGKIPVVFVHGTASSPARWAELFNGLHGYPQLRERFEYWFFVYSTGNPIAYSAGLLREALHDAVQKFDPDDQDASLRKMVIIGHSQGGLLARLLAIGSGNAFWALLSDSSPEELDIPEDQRDLLKRAMIFERTPFVSRVVFVATPHRGSFQAGRWYGRLAGSLVSLPSTVVNSATRIFESADERFLRELGGHVPTSITNMEPGNRFLKALNSIPIHPEVKTHSIIAVKDDAGSIVDGNDGVVEYTSARLEGVESEFVVFSGHSCQSNPLTILEVRRILREHLKSLEDGDSK